MRLQRGVFLLYKVYAVQKKRTKKRLKNKPSALTTPQLGEKIKVEKGIKKKQPKNTEVSKLKNVTAIPFHAS